MARKKKSGARTGGSVGPFGYRGPALDMSRSTNQGVTNMIVGGSQCNGAGAQSTGGSTTWSIGGSLALSIATATNQTFQAYVIQPAVAGTTQVIGRARVDAVIGSIFIRCGAVGRVVVGVGIYMSQNNSANIWEIQDPLASADANRDNWLFLKAFDYDAAGGFPATAITTVQMFEVPLNISRPLVVGAGQAIHVTVSSGALSAGALQVSSAFRTRVGPVA